MKICLVHEEYPEETNFGGISTYQKRCAEEYANMGHDVTVICRGLNKSYSYVENGVKIYRIYDEEQRNKIKQYKSYRIKVKNLLIKLQENNCIDIIEVPDWGAETILFEKYRKVPLVVRLHTPLKVWLRYNKNNFGNIKNLMLKWENHMIKSADFVTCCSEALKRIIVKDFNIKEEDIVVTPNPSDIKNFYLDKNITKENNLLFVGSLEERKGVCVLAKALNIVFNKYPNINIKFIGKDTNRNNKNISTIEYIKKTVDEKYRDNLIFLGQLPNNNLNKYLNQSMIGIFPSLFDNFPYVVLESMATGIQIVGSENSGMKEMLNDDSSLYESGNYKDLANKIISKIELYKKEPINYNNIERLKKEYNPKKICNQMINCFNDVIHNYKLTNITKEELEIILKNITDNNKIKKYNQETGGVANYVYRVYTSDNTYIIKKYTNRNNFDLSNMLYDLYSKNNINIIRPINKNIIKYNNINYNVFYYKKNKHYKKINDDFINNILNCDRKVNISNTLNDKCNKYYNKIKEFKFNEKLQEDVEFVKKIFSEIKDLPLFDEQYLNHGDISRGNVIYADNKYYLIDFDEALISSKLYDFAVIIIKNYVYNNNINYSKFNYLKKFFNEEYSDNDFYNIIKYYLCKILLEKFYLYKIGEIDLYSKRQKKDFYKKYIILLKNICKKEFS